MPRATISQLLGGKEGGGMKRGWQRVTGYREEGRGRKLNEQEGGK